jgi:hypothetical protein
LPAAIFVLAVIALFIAGSAFTTTQESRAAVGSLSERVALEAAEYGVAAVLRDWKPSWNTSMAIGHSSVAITSSHPGSATSTTRLTRISQTTWWIVSEGTVAGRARRQTRRTVNAIVRLDLPPDEIEAALSVTDTARIVTGGMVIGSDTSEVFGGCPAVAPRPVAGVASPDTLRTCDGACGGAPAGNVIGVPRLAGDSAVAARVASMLGSVAADIVLPGGSVVTPAPTLAGGACDTLPSDNWGDPDGGACASHLPVIKVAGDLTILGGKGQGVILAGGDVVIAGGARFHGVIVAGDDIVTGAGGAAVLGAVLAGDSRRSPGDHSVIGAGAVIRRSACRVNLARYAAASPVRVRQRWWSEFP